MRLFKCDDCEYPCTVIIELGTRPQFCPVTEGEAHFRELEATKK